MAVGGRQRRRQARPGHRQLRLRRRVGAAGQRRRHLPGPRHASRPGAGPPLGGGGGRQRRRQARPGHRQHRAPTTCRCCWATATAPSRPQATLRRRDRSLAPWRWRTSTATASPTWSSANAGSDDVSVLLGNGDGTFQPPRRASRPGATPASVAVGDVNGDGRPDLVVGQLRLRRRVGAAGQRRRHLPAPAATSRRDRAPPRWRWRTSTATAGPTWSRANSRLRRRVGAAGQRRRHLPGPRRASPSGARPYVRGGGGRQRRRPARPGHGQLRLRRRVGAAGQRRRHLPGPGTLRGRGRSPPRWRSADVNGDGRPDLVTANVATPTTCRCCWATATAPSRPTRDFAAGSQPHARWRWGRQRRRPARPGHAPTTAPATCRCCWATATAPSRPRHASPPGAAPDSVAVADVNGDGRPDLVTANYRHRRRVGAAGQRRRHLPGPRHASRPGTQPRLGGGGDVNGDGRPDLVTANTGSDDVSVLLGNGDGTFQAQPRFAAGTQPPLRGGRRTSTATAGPTSSPPTD